MAMFMKNPYIGSGNYCYANSMAMVLQSYGYSYDPGYLECLTAVANSAFWTDSKSPVIFFSSKFNSPDQGISLALRNLGFQFDEFYLNEDPPKQEFVLSKLSDFLKNGPVIAGPLDMGKLTYIPYAKDLKGVDHYITVYEIDNYIHAHDPAGYPHIQIDVNDFLDAWKAEKINYRRGSFSMWGNIRKVAEPSLYETYLATNEAIKHFLSLEQKSEGSGLTGGKAIEKLAQLLLEVKLSPVQKGNLAYFSFPLSARRCNDYARFFEPYDADRSKIKYEQAKCFGKSQMYLMKQRWDQLYETLCDLADLEEEFQIKTIHS